MEDVELVVNDALCYLLNKFGKSNVKLLKSTLLDFYDVEDISAAKLRLLEDIRKLNLTIKHPYMPQRRDGDLRLAREVDDVLSLFTFLDEQKLISQLPKYVANGPDGMPSQRLYDGDLNVVMSLLRNMEGRFIEMRGAIVALTRDIRALQSKGSEYTQCARPASARQEPVMLAARDINKPDTRRQKSPVRGNSNINAGLIESAPTSDFECEDANANVSTSDWATLVSTPITHDNRYAVLASNTDDEQPFTTVQRRSNKRPRQKTADHQRTTASSATVAAAAAAAAATAGVQQQQQAQRRNTTLLGKSTGTTTKISAAKRIRKRAVFCIDNVNVDCSVDDVKSFVSGMSVEVISCFEVKSRRRRDEIDVSDRKAFRLCIFNDDRNRLMDISQWPDSVKISDWFFKPPTQGGDDDGDKRRRIDLSARDAGHSTQHAASAMDNGAVASASVLNVSVGEGNMSTDDTILAVHNPSDGE